MTLKQETFIKFKEKTLNKSKIVRAALSYIELISFISQIKNSHITKRTQFNSPYSEPCGSYQAGANEQDYHHHHHHHHQSENMNGIFYT